MERRKQRKTAIILLFAIGVSVVGIISVAIVTAAPEGDALLEAVQDGAGVMFWNGLYYNDSNDSASLILTCADGQLLRWNGTSGLWYCATGSGLTQEQVEDYVGGMTSGTETRISVTYDDPGGNLNYVVDDMNDDDPEAGDVHWSDLTDQGTHTDTKICTYASGTGFISCDYTDVDTDTYNTTEEMQDAVGGGFGTGLYYDDAGNSFNFLCSDVDGDHLSCAGQVLNVADDWWNAYGDFMGATSGGDWCTWNGAAIDCNVTPVSDTDTYNTTEEMQDAVMAAIDDGTQTHITITYQDATNDMDFVVSDDWWDSYSDFMGTTTSGKICRWDGSEIDCDYTDQDTDTYNTTEEMQDAVWTSGIGTTTRITVTYQDATNDVDFVVDDMNDDQPDNDGEVPDDITVTSTKNITSTEGIILDADNKYIWIGDTQADDSWAYWNGTCLVIENIGNSKLSIC